MKQIRDKGKIFYKGIQTPSKVEATRFAKRYSRLGKRIRIKAKRTMKGISYTVYATE